MLLRLKAEIVLAVQLVSRHRAVRLAATLLLLMTVAIASSAPAGGRVGGAQGVILLMAGMVAAVAGSRLLAPGGALTALRMAAARWWIAPAGRILGAGIVVYPLVLVPIVVLIAPRASAPVILMAIATAALYTACVIACVAALTPATGASAAAALGFFAAWIGQTPPSGIQSLTASVPALQGPLVLLWNVLPFPWRANRWFVQGTPEDAAVLFFWTALGFVGAAWSAERFYRVERPSEENRWL
ncbi:hypothetical protein HRbin33_00295 [bacterium HR33]|nr:hypothetical protein HRbin33_00295 [bacterium HR33]